MPDQNVDLARISFVIEKKKHIYSTTLITFSDYKL